MDACIRCGAVTKYYDKVTRLIRSSNRTVENIEVKRYRCVKCGSVIRDCPDELVPNKQYDKGIIQGVIEGLITPDTYGYEDYPCESTMIRWIKEYHRSYFYKKQYEP